MFEKSHNFVSYLIWSCSTDFFAKLIAHIIFTQYSFDHQWIGFMISFQLLQISLMQCLIHFSSQPIAASADVFC